MILTLARGCLRVMMARTVALPWIHSASQRGDRFVQNRSSRFATWRVKPTGLQHPTFAPQARAQRITTRKCRCWWVVVVVQGWRVGIVSLHSYKHAIRWRNMENEPQCGSCTAHLIFRATECERRGVTSLNHRVLRDVPRVIHLAHKPIIVGRCGSRCDVYVKS